MDMKIDSVIARDSSADPADILTVKRMLNRLGHYVPDREIGMNSIADAALFDALKAFQKQTGLPETGMVGPGDTTWQALSEAYVRPAGDDDAYIWTTTGDDRVRPSHHEREGKRFLWKDHPWPGEEPDCRCWAIPAARKPAQAVTPATLGHHCFREPWLHLAEAGIRRFENDRAYPYGDSKGFITVGVGTNVNREAIFLALPWRIGDENGRPASNAEIRDGYEKLSGLIAAEMKKARERGSQSINLSAALYERITNLRLSPAERSGMLGRDIAAFLRELDAKFAGFDCFPGPAKAALMDMIYNIGGTKFTKAKWPALFAAVAARDWSKVATESRRADLEADRNAATVELFKRASEMEGVGAV